jgi:hypothetical protein
MSTSRLKEFRWNLHKACLAGRTLVAHPNEIFCLLTGLYPQIAEVWRQYADIPAETLWDLFPGIESYHMPLNGRLIGYLVPAIVHHVRAKTVFEFGTSTGTTTLRVARAMAAFGGEVITVDLPPQVDVSQLNQSWMDTKGIPESPGTDLQGVEFENVKIRQIFCDSRHLDVSPFVAKVDVVYIDGGHDYDVVKSDSSKAFELLDPEGPQIVIWHDYTPGHLGVVTCLEEISRDEPLVRIAGTSWVVFRGKHS